MPTYTYEDENTGTEYEIILPYSEFVEFLKENPTCKQTFRPLQIAYRPPGVKGTGFKYSEVWKEKLKGLKKFYKNSTVNDNI